MRLKSRLVAMVASLLLTLPTLAQPAQDPLSIRNGDLSQEAARAALVPQARVDNVLFTMPEGWRRIDKPDLTAIAPPAGAQGQWIELRILPAEPKNGTARDHLQRSVDATKQTYTGYHELAPLAQAKTTTGEQVVLLPFAVQDPNRPGNTLVFIFCHVETGDLVQAFVLATNTPALYQQHQPTFSRVLDSVRFANQDVLADNKPPLTQLTVYRVQDFLEWVLDVPFTEEQKRTVRDHLVKSWRANDRKEIDGCAQILQMRDQVNALDKAKQEVARQALQPEALKNWRAGADEIDRFLVAVYDAGHRPIAPGDPPLTRQVTDATVELFYFMASQVDGGGTVAPTSEIKDQFSNKIAQTWPTLNASGRTQMTQMPLMWATLRAAWPEAPAAERQKLVEQFRTVPEVQQLAARFAKMREQAHATRAAGQDAYLDLMQKAQRQHENFMFMSNMANQMHQTRMIQIYSMGNGWEYRRR